MKDLVSTAIGSVVLVVCTTAPLHGAGREPLRPASAPRLTVERLKSLKATANEPSGDSFVDSKEKLGELLDAFVADSSLASPTYLYLAAGTASRLGRVEDAAFLLYAAQLRKAFDYGRYDVVSDPGNDAATYLAFLNQTIGESVNPAIMRQPKAFASAISRLEAWDVAPSTNAYYTEFPKVKGWKVPPAGWPKLAASLKEDFLSSFARKYVVLLADPAYFEAFAVVQDFNFGRVDPKDKKALDRFEKSREKMRAIENERFPPTAAPTAAPAAISRAPAPVRAAGRDTPVRVGGEVPEPKKIHHVEPAFPAGARGSVILELTIGRLGKVERVSVLRSEPALTKAAEEAVRQWIFEPVLVMGKPVSVILTVSLNAR
jgi:TonB family protein